LRSWSWRGGDIPWPRRGNVLHDPAHPT
jgi:hypothetical protein